MCIRDSYYALAGFLRSSRYQDAFIEDAGKNVAQEKKLAELQKQIATALASVEIKPEEVTEALNKAVANLPDLNKAPPLGQNQQMPAEADPKRQPIHPVIQPWAELSKAPASNFEWFKNDLLRRLRSRMEADPTLD